MRCFESEAEVQQYQKKTGMHIVIYQKVVYETSDYEMQHPGGYQVIASHFGKSMDEEFDEQGHTKAALRIIKQMPRVGYVKGAEDIEQDCMNPKIDLNNKY